MTLGGRPLQDNVHDAALFVGREPELAALTAALQHDLNVIVVGAAGIGKTSLLKTFMHRMRTAGEPASSAGEHELRYVRAEAIANGQQLLARVATEFLGRARDPDADVQQTLQALRKYRQDLAVAHRAKARPKGAGGQPTLKIVVIVDDVTAVGGTQLFGWLRDELWALGFRWVVAIRGTERGFLTPPADAFFERVIPLGPLSMAEATDLIDRRQLWPAGWSAAVARAVGGYPRTLLATARDLVDRPEELAASLDLLKQRDDAIAQVGRPALMLAAELDALGSASASDDALLNRLGWTRARASQVLTQLDQAGLVRSNEQKQGQGRPKRVFRLVTAGEFAPNVTAGEFAPDG